MITASSAHSTICKYFPTGNELENSCPQISKKKKKKRLKQIIKLDICSLEISSIFLTLKVSIHWKSLCRKLFFFFRMMKNLKNVSLSPVFFLPEVHRTNLSTCGKSIPGPVLPNEDLKAWSSLIGPISQEGK